MTMLLFFLAGALALSLVIKLCLAVYAPKAYEALMAEEDRHRERRNSAFKSGLGLAFRFLKK